MKSLGMDLADFSHIFNDVPEEYADANIHEDYVLLKDTNFCWALSVLWIAPATFPVLIKCQKTKTRSSGEKLHGVREDSIMIFSEETFHNKTPNPHK